VFNWLNKKKAAPTPSDAAIAEREKIFPRLKHLNFIEALQPVLKQFEEAGGDPIAGTPVTRPLAGDLLISYAFDRTDRWSAVSNRQMLDLGLDPDTLHALAMSNLEKAFSHLLQIENLKFYKLITTGYELEACAMLLPGLWDRLAGEIRGELLVVVPTVDQIFFMGSQDDLTAEGRTINAKQILGFMCSTAAQLREEEKVNALSRKVFTWSSGAWSVHGELSEPR
jgi:hypothetical protein